MKITWVEDRNRWLVESITSYEYGCLSADNMEPHLDNFVEDDLVYDDPLPVSFLITRCLQWRIKLDIVYTVVNNPFVRDSHIEMVVQRQL